MKNIEKDLKKIKTKEEKEKYILEIIENLDYGEKIELLDKLIFSYNQKYKKLAFIKKQFELYLNTTKLFKSNKELKESKEIKNFLKDIKENIEIEHHIENGNKYYYPTLTLNDAQLIKIDEIINKDTYNMFKKLEKTASASTRLNILLELKKIYEKELIEVKKNKNYNDIRLVKIAYKYINSAIRIEHKKLKHNNKQNNDIKQEEKEKLTKNQSNILELMENNKNIDDYDLSEILIAYKKLITNDINNYSIEVLKYSKYISNRIIESVITDDKVIKLIGSIRDTIKYRLLSLDKKDPKNDLERSILKEIRIIFDFISKNYKEDLTKTKHDYMYDVIKYFLQDEEGYPYIKRITEYIPNVVNVKNNNSDLKQEEHILISILKEYIYNYKKLLKDKNSDYINPDYIKQIYILFSKAENLKLTKEEKEIINKYLDEFLIYVNENIYKEDRKKEAKKEIKQLKTDYYFYERLPKLKNIKENQLFYQIEALKDNKRNALNRHNRIRLIDEETICINDIAAYSYIEKNEQKILKIHITDTSAIVAPNTTVDSEIYNYMINNEIIDYNIRKNLELNLYSEIPTITYELTFEKNNEVSNFNIYRSVIKVDKKCNDENLCFKNNETLNNIELLARKQLLHKNKEVPKMMGLYSIQKTLEIILNEEFIRYVQKNNIPFLYSGIEYVNDYINHMNNLNSIFNRLEQNEFNILYRIISGNVGEFGYSKELFKVEDEYNLHLINDMNYLLIFNQRLIVDIILNNEEVKSKQKYIKEIEELEHNLNLSINHIKPDYMKFKNKRKRNKLKEYSLY